MPATVAAGEAHKTGWARSGVRFEVALFGEGRPVVAKQDVVCFTADAAASPPRAHSSDMGLIEIN